ncbi:terminase small subunit [Escherichia coli]|uniref:terminase small subunit n=1 Tax=Escherichia coli TaxID=562 RepID=UPI003F6A2E0A
MNTAANYGGFILHGTITTTVTITTVVMMPAEPKTYKRKSTQFKPLTAMQEAYCQSYIKTPENQTQAAINAGFSPNTAAVKASVMMRDERIKKRIAELMEERNKRMRVSADYVLMRLVEIDQMDVLDILNDDGGMKPIAEWPKVWRTSLSAMDIATIKTTQASLQKENGEADLSVEDVEHILKKVKWPDKVKNSSSSVSTSTLTRSKNVWMLM